MHPWYPFAHKEITDGQHKTDTYSISHTDIITIYFGNLSSRLKVLPGYTLEKYEHPLVVLSMIEMFTLWVSKFSNNIWITYRLSLKLMGIHHWYSVSNFGEMECENGLDTMWNVLLVDWRND